MNVLFDKLMDLCYGTLFPMHDVVMSTLLAISNSHVLHVGECFALLKDYW